MKGHKDDVATVERAMPPSAKDVARAARALFEKARTRARPDDLDARDPRFIASIEPLLGLFYDAYFRCETEIEAELPKGKFLAVANHNAMTGIPDMFCHMVAFWRSESTSRVGYGLMHDVPFNVPGAGPWLNACGAVRANQRNAKAALDRGAAVLVFPGGDLDACKPWSRRYEIEFGGRRGFLRVAIREGAPVVPVVSVGAHESLYIFTDGRRIAERLHLPALARSNVAPLGFALPWGLIAGVPVPHLPPPVKVHTKFLAPIDLAMDPKDADDPEAVERAFNRVVEPMRDAMEDLRRAGRHGLFPKG